tara:strand:- start:2873 stop:3409 length:537 start_codon:yes stop_codon:yes gene_type:complete
MNDTQMTKEQVRALISITRWLELGRRAVACERWRWMPGMLAIDTGCIDADCIDADCPEKYLGLRVIDVAHTVVHQELDGSMHEGVLDGRPVVPDLRDPATRGCLLALVRDVLGEPCAFVLTELTERRALEWYAAALIVKGEKRQVLQSFATPEPGLAEAAVLVSALGPLRLPRDDDDA